MDRVLWLVGRCFGVGFYVNGNRVGLVLGKDDLFKTWWGIRI